MALTLSVVLFSLFLTFRTQALYKTRLGTCWAKGNAFTDCARKYEIDEESCTFEHIRKMNIIVLTVASNITDGYKRLLRSAREYEVDVQTLGLNEPWRGGSMESTGGGQKIIMLRQHLLPFKDDDQTIILFTDGYDVVYLSNTDEILKKFLQTESRVLFSAERNCWPDKSLVSKYPSVARGKQYLNSGGFMGYANDLYAILSYHEISDNEDDQLYYTHVYLDPEMREKHKIQLDHNSSIFFNLYASSDDIELKWKNDDAYLEDVVSSTRPSILHGNGRSKESLNNLANYLARAWQPGVGCRECKENVLPKLEDEQLPRVLVTIFISRPTPFLEEFFTTTASLNYPKDKMDLFLFNAVEEHESAITAFLDANNFRTVKRIKAKDSISEQHARSLAIDHFLNKKVVYLFNIDSEARLDNPHTLKLLIEQNRGVVAPLLIRPYKAWSNFWGALTEDGFYARSFDYMDIVNNVKRGLWNVPYVTSCYLINGTVIRNPKTRPSYTSGSLDQDMAFSHNMRKNGVFLYVSNRVDFGHLIDPEDFDMSKLHPELHNIIQNQWDWERRYIHEDYHQNLNPEVPAMQPCPDVFWFPVASDRFCNELIETMENFGKWSAGSNHDERLNGGYEAVPTRDIHMNQVGLEKQWLQFLKLYVLPLNQRVFTGYQDSAPRSIMNFVVRYKPDEQPSLRPHHDTSTYTINIALNTPNIDFEATVTLDANSDENRSDESVRTIKLCSVHESVYSRCDCFFRTLSWPPHSLIVLTDSSEFASSVTVALASSILEGGGCRFLRYNCSVTDTKKGWMLMHPGRLTHYHEGLLVTKGVRYIMISFIDP